MTATNKPYSLIQLSSAIFMILALLWLTISAPFVYQSQQALHKQGKLINADYPLADNEEETTNPLGTTTEEKAPTSTTAFSEEYLHDHHINHYFFFIPLQYYKCDNASIYIAYHGELLVPPPNAA